MATMQSMQATLSNPYWQLQTPYIYKSNITLQQKFRVDSPGYAQLLDAQSYTRKSEESMLRVHDLRYFQPGLQRTFPFKISTGRLRTSYVEHRCKKAAGIVCCLQTRQVEEVDQKEVEVENNLSSLSNEKSSSDDTDLQGRAVRKGLSALNTYFDKLHASKGNQCGSASLVTNNQMTGTSTVLSPVESRNEVSSTGSRTSQVGNVVHETKNSQENHETKESKGLKALDAYFNKLRPSKPEEVVSTVLVETDKEAEKKDVAERKGEEEERGEEGQEKKGKIEIIVASEPGKEEEEEKFYRELLQELETALEQGGESESSSTSDEDISRVPSWGLQAGSSNSYLVNVLVAVNIAVYLFGLASPHGMPGMADASLPYLYGSKVNELIVNGEWWRLITPMFLHSGLLHLGLSTWALLSFGPAVESAYGTLGFGMIYLIGGLFGNLLSFFHTHEDTVGGTGPIYALMATWLVYLLRNRNIIGLEIADDMIRKVVIMTAINVALCNSFPIDDWTHLGAGAVGVIFGLLTCPMVQANVHVEEVVGDNATDDTMESYLLLNEGLHPYRLLVVFALCLAVFFGLYNLGVPIATEFHFLHGGLSDEYW